MNLLINGKPSTLAASDKIGSGGEGDVYKHGTKKAVKILHKPNVQYGRKMTVMLANPPTIPSGCGIIPTGLCTDIHGNVIGIEMDRIGAGYEDLTQLASKKHRTQYKVTTKQVGNLFLNGGKTVLGIHNSGYCIGDFSDFNEKYQGESMLFLDVDSWQFSTFPCPVATEQFLAPELYGIDLSAQPVFTPNHDWYSFFVLLIKSLLGVHPYGGTHRKINLLTERALSKTTVLDSDVIYPQIGLSPDLLNDDMKHLFHEVFKLGKRGVFPLAVLGAYVLSLVDCPNCGATYPSQRKHCPVCSTVHVAPVTTSFVGIKVTDLFKTKGPILFSKMIGNALYVIAREKNNTRVLYVYNPQSGVERENMGIDDPGTRYDIDTDHLVYSEPNDDGITMIDIPYVVSDQKSTFDTEVFAGNNRAMFRASQRYIFRIVNGQLLAGEFKYKGYIERVIRSVAQDQTWFTARNDSNEKPTLCGFMQVFREQRWWLYYEGLLYDGLNLTNLAIDEVQMDVMVKFDNSSVLIKRVTQQGGVDYLHSAMVSSTGTVVNQVRVKLTAPLPHGAAYAHGVLLSPTDDGLVQDKNGVLKTFTQTKGIIEEGDTIHVSNNGLIVVKDQEVTLVQLG